MSAPPTLLACRTAGLTVSFSAPTRGWWDFAAEACAGQVQEAPPVAARDSATLRIVVEESREAFPTGSLDLVTRGVHADGRTVVLTDVLSTGMDLHVRHDGDVLTLRARHRPSLRARALARAAPSRQVLLLRCALLQYPAMWWAGVLSGAAPVHVSALVVQGSGVVLAGPGGVGKSTLVRAALDRGVIPVSDNLCVSDGIRVHGVLEPGRDASGTGRRMPHGRREGGWVRLQSDVTAEQVLLLHRPGVAEVEPSLAGAVRAIIGSTYSAGELRRYWPFAAVLAMGTGRGPVHPPVERVAQQLCHNAVVDRLDLSPGAPQPQWARGAAPTSS